MKYKLLATALAILITTSTFSQSNFIANDTSINSGVKIKSGTRSANSKYVSVLGMDGKKNKYTPNDIMKYGLKDGTIYTSKEVKFKDEPYKKYFLKIISKNKLPIYYLRLENKNYYFFENDSLQLIELSKSKGSEFYYKTVLKRNVNCESALKALTNVKLNSNSLKAFSQKSISCSSTPLPFLKYGISSGISNYSMSYSAKGMKTDHLNRHIPNKKPKNDTQVALSLGLFLEFPLYYKNLAIHTEINYTKLEFSFNENHNNTEIQIKQNYRSFTLPILLRYYFYQKSTHYYLNTGFNYSFDNLLSFNTNISTSDKDLLANIELNSYPDDNIHSFGFTGGIGLQYDLNIRRSIFFEIRYNNQFHKSLQIRKYNYSLVMGVNF